MDKFIKRTSLLMWAGLFGKDRFKILDWWLLKLFGYSRRLGPKKKNNCLLCEMDKLHRIEQEKIRDEMRKRISDEYSEWIMKKCGVEATLVWRDLSLSCIDIRKEEDPDDSESKSVHDIK